jgi:hypothetical protein
MSQIRVPRPAEEAGEDLNNFFGETQGDAEDEGAYLACRPRAYLARWPKSKTRGGEMNGMESTLPAHGVRWKRR